MKVAICDDDPKDLDEYESLLNNTLMSVQVVAYSNGKQMLFELSSPEAMPDVIYLDVNMPDMSGIEVAKELRNRKYEGEIIFLTKSEEYWKSAFNVHAYQYIVKDDCTKKRFSEIFTEAIVRSRLQNDERILFTNGGEVASMLIRDIRYFEVTNRIVKVYYQDKIFEFYSPLSKLAEELSEQNFLRIHGSYLVYVPYIKLNFRSLSMKNKEIVLKDNTRLPIGRTYAAQVKEAFFDINKRTMKNENNT